MAVHYTVTACSSSNLEQSLQKYSGNKVQYFYIVCAYASTTQAWSLSVQEIRALRNEVRCELDIHELSNMMDIIEGAWQRNSSRLYSMLWIGMDECIANDFTHSTVTYTHTHRNTNICTHAHRGLHGDHVRFAISGLKLKLGSSSA